jgi:hypothetical protein
MPQDTSFGAYFPGGAAAPAQMPLMCMASMPVPPSPAQAAHGSVMDAASSVVSALFRRKSAVPAQAAGQPPKDTDDLLLDLVSRILPDGGMPGSNDGQRMIATVMAVMWLVAEGHTLKRGAFRSHVERLTRYLEGLRKSELEEILKAVKKGKALEGNWRTGQPADCPVLARLGIV